MRFDGVLPYEFVEDSSTCQLTGHAGLLPYLDLACALGLLKAVDENVQACGQRGWMDRRHVLSLMLLNLAGGECIDDIKMLESDRGLCRIFEDAEEYGLSRSQCKELKKRFRKGRRRSSPSSEMETFPPDMTCRG